MSEKEKHVVAQKGLTDTSQAKRGKDLYYHCGICGAYIPSQPEDSISCKCANIIIDVEYVRLLVKDFSKFSVVRQLP
jgi:hypothetical protein